MSVQSQALCPWFSMGASWPGLSPPLLACNVWSLCLIVVLSHEDLSRGLTLLRPQDRKSNGRILV